MATGYTLEQLAAMDALLFQNIPRHPDEDDVRKAPIPPSISTATVPSSGILVNFGKGKNGRDQMQFLTPIVARQLLRGILFAAQQNGWWDDQLNIVSEDGRLLYLQNGEVN